MILYCTSDNAGPFTSVDWSALPSAARLTCPSHVLRNGGAPRVGSPHRALAAADEVVLGGAPDAHGGLLATLDNGEPLRCPECLSPLRAVDSAPAWTPPDGLPADVPPAPEAAYRTSATLVSDERAITAEWSVLGRVTTAVGGLVADLTRALGGFVGEVDAVGGDVELQLVERVLATGVERVLVSRTVHVGLGQYVQALTDPGAPAYGPCGYRLEGRLVGAISGAVRGVSLALYEVQQ